MCHSRSRRRGLWNWCGMIPVSGRIGPVLRGILRLGRFVGHWIVKVRICCLSLSLRGWCSDLGLVGGCFLLGLRRRIGCGLRGMGRGWVGVWDSPACSAFRP
ncbi:unnamed protein product [Penicillium salamii]|nr:unnamed protein product [Penicillium salamii]CAG8429669.1 unnamed protein product [Penicillium salamii]